MIIINKINIKTGRIQSLIVWQNPVFVSQQQPYWTQPASAFIRCYVKPCLKYPVTIVVLLLIGYSQLFAQVNRGIASTEIGKSRTVVSQRGGLIPANSVDIIFQETAMEEEEDRISTDAPPSRSGSFFIAESVPSESSSRRTLTSHHMAHRPSSINPWKLFRVFRLWCCGEIKFNAPRGAVLLINAIISPPGQYHHESISHLIKFKCLDMLHQLLFAWRRERRGA
jgi:hypothetical protein